MRLTELVTPLKPLEAMAQGKLVVASDVGGHRELIQNNVTGLLFKAGDCRSLSETVLHMLSVTERWSDFRTAGRLFVEADRNWASSVARYEQVYPHLIKRNVSTSN
jgi:glycosyltransferase involved in cell wall biosynthesis